MDHDVRNADRLGAQALYNRAEDTVKRLISLSPNTWRVEFDNGTTATWRLEKKRLMVTIGGDKKRPSVWEKMP